MDSYSFDFFSSYNVWKHVCYHALISRQPGVITQFIYIYIYIYIYTISTKRRDYIVRSSYFFMKFVTFKNAFTFGRWCHIYKVSDPKAPF